MAAYVSCQTTPVPILKQINRVNDDGSYTYGFEAADGSFKVETRTAQGDVRGKYGYIDETGILKTVVYGAGEIGFEADGEHLPEQPISAPFSAKQRDADAAAFTPAASPKRKQQQTAAPVVTQQVAPVVQSAPVRSSTPIGAFNQFDIKTVRSIHFHCFYFILTGSNNSISLLNAGPAHLHVSPAARARCPAHPDRCSAFERSGRSHSAV